MKLKSLFAVILSITFLFSPLIAGAQNYDFENSIIDSKIREINNLTFSLSLSQQQDFNTFYPDKAKKKEVVDQYLQEANNIHIEVEEFFNTIDSEDFYQSVKFEELINSLDRLDLEVSKVENQPIYDIGGPGAMSTVTTSSTMSTTSTSWRYGDILYYGIGSNNALGEPSFTGHTAVLSTTDYFVIEAARTANNGAKVHHWNRSNLWRGASGIKQYKVTTKLGKNASTTERRTAVNFGLNQVGEPYKLKTTIFSSDAWYCSKLTMRQWYNAGYDLRGARGLHISGILLVIPYDIRIDANTRLNKDWGTSLPGKI
jgi:hypothetical protein